MIGLPDQPRLLEFGALQVKKVAASPTFEVNIDLHGADEIRVLQRGLHVFQMSR